jgi:hypothetical protein
MKHSLRFAAVLAAVSLLVTPLLAQRGSADFTRFVAIGDSYGAGVSNGSINERHTMWSWPAILARQAGAPQFVQPLVSYPGIGPELVLVDVVAFPPRIVPASGLGAPLNATHPAPFNNLSVPGAAVRDVTTITGGEQNPQGTAQMTARFILRGLGTAVQQAIAQQPTFVAIWIGGNDLLGAVLSGTPAALTPTETFRTAYNAMLDQLTAGAPNAGIIVGNLPTNALALPLLSTVPPFIVDPVTRQPVRGPDGNPIFFIYRTGPDTVAQLPPGSVVLLPASAKLGSGVGIPPTLRNVPPFNQLPNVGTPLEGSDVLTPEEQLQIATRAGEYNAVIQQAASSRNIPVADIESLFDRFAAPGGYRVGPLVFSPAYIQGGIFSLDGFHMTDIGYLFFANEYIRTINQAWHAGIPVAGLSQLFENNGAFFPNDDDLQAPELSAEAAASIMWYATAAGAPRRLRAAGH